MDHFSNMDIPMSLVPDKMYLRVPRELADVTATLCHL